MRTKSEKETVTENYLRKKVAKIVLMVQITDGNEIWVRYKT